MVSFLYLALFGIFILFVMGIVSNTNSNSIEAVENQLFLINCPPPIYNGVVTDADFEGFTVVYNVTISNSTSSFDGTYFDCYLEDTAPPATDFRLNVISKPYDTTLFSAIPIGYFGFLSDTISFQAGKAVNYGTLLSFVLTPANFNVLGYGLDDIGGFALGIIIMIYLIAYIFIVIFIIDRVTSIIGSFT